LLQSLRQWAASPTALRLANLQTPQIEQAWRRREIDAAAVSEPMLGTLLADGRLVRLVEPLHGVGLIALTARSAFVASHIVFLSRLIDLMTHTSGKLTDHATILSANGIKAIAMISGLATSHVLAAISQHQPPPVDEQLSERWLGGGDRSEVVSQLKEALEVWRWAGRPGNADVDVSSAIELDPLRRARSYRH
jgi:taurine transport system substrate-binding protein